MAAVGLIRHLELITLTAEQFDGLADGYGDPSALAVLASGQLSKRMVLLHEVVRRTRDIGDPAGVAAVAGLAVIAEVDRRRPDVVRHILGHPQLGAWAASCLRALSRPEGIMPTEVWQLNAFAAAAAARADVPFDVTVLTRQQTVVLPTLGAVSDLGDGPAHLHGDGSSLVVAGPARTVSLARPFDAVRQHWIPLRTIAVEADGLELAVVVEDLDPHRNCYSWRPAGRLDPADLDHLHALLTEAWRLIVRDHPRHAGCLSNALRSVVPLYSPDPSGPVSAASRDAFGSVALSLPASPVTLAELLIHEFQHVKLGGLLDLVELHDSGGAARHYAPWRADPRPIGGLLQGTYAFVGVTDFWRRHRVGAFGRARRTADFEFAFRRRQTARAIAELKASGELTPDGRRFVAHLAHTLRRWLAEPVEPGIDAAAHDAALIDAVRWRLRHRYPPADQLDHLVEAWCQGRHCPEMTDVDWVPQTHTRAVERSDLAHLIRYQATGAGPPVPAGRADRALLAGDYVEAQQGYLDAIAREQSLDAWAGLAVTSHRLGRLGAGALAARPELVQAMVARIPGQADPESFARWLAPGLPPLA